MEAWGSRECLWLGVYPGSGRLAWQDHRRRGMGNGVVQPGETGWVWVTKGLEEFGLYSALSGDGSDRSKGIPFFLKNLFFIFF